ncbi:MAG: tRNA (adenosine(37)-N6)-threonylcarbamoyltransferase complex ATPase subunit type 1 TsaE [Clostridia bacterium]|nr:tRNA (adenosine(37)-N6)-threonylcarbamoyltransferase complex ATPase subunit type 1 TsaE [Clostridia bacterium]
MSETKSLELNALSEADMYEVGRSIGNLLDGHAFIAMFGDLGAGTTTLTKGIAEALGIHDILSPTFTIVRHHEGRLALDHFDAYRIESVDELYAIGFDDYLSGDGVIVMEWCENVPDALPQERLEVHIEGSGGEPRNMELVAFGSKYFKILEVLSKC